MERLMAFLVTTPAGCMEYQGAKFRSGYGNFRWSGYRNVGAHRAMYELTVGPVPDGLRVLHRCYNPPCCNPEHLFIGTQAENMADKARKGRRATPEAFGHPGESNPSAKLTEDDVRSIRASDEGPTLLAQRYGVSVVSICNVRSRRTWKHVE